MTEYISQLICWKFVYVSVMHNALEPMFELHYTYTQHTPFERPHDLVCSSFGNTKFRKHFSTTRLSEKRRCMQCNRPTIFSLPTQITIDRLHIVDASKKALRELQMVVYAVCIHPRPRCGSDVFVQGRLSRVRTGRNTRPQVQEAMSTIVLVCISTRRPRSYESTQVFKLNPPWRLRISSRWRSSQYIWTPDHDS